MPGRSPPTWPASWAAEAIKLASNEVPYGPLPGVVEAVTEAAAGVAPLPGHGRGRAARRARRAATASTPDRIATGCGSVALAEHLVRGHLPARRRGRLLVALVRGVPDHRGDRRRDQRAGAEHRRTTATTSTAMAAAITDRTRLIFVCNPNNPTGTAVRRAELDRVPRRGAGRRAGGARRGVPGVRHRRRTCPDGLERVRRPAQRGGAAHAVQGVGPGRAAGRLPGRRSPRWPPRSARWSRRSPPAAVAQAAALAALDQAEDEMHAGAARWWSPSGTGSPRRCASCCRTCPTTPGQLRLAAAGRPGGRVRRRPARSAGVIVRPFAGRRRPGHHRHAGGERRLPRRGGGLLTHRCHVPGRDGCRHG